MEWTEGAPFVKEWWGVGEGAQGDWYNQRVRGMMAGVGERYTIKKGGLRGIMAGVGERHISGEGVE